MNSVARASKIELGHNTAPADLNDRLKTHSMAKLVNLLNILISGLADDSDSAKLPSDIAKTLDSLTINSINDGFEFRYTTQLVNGNWIPLRPMPVKLYIVGAVSRLKEAAEILHYGYGGWLGNYNNYLGDMESEYKVNNSSDYRDRSQ